MWHQELQIDIQSHKLCWTLAGIQLLLQWYVNQEKTIVDLSITILLFFFCLEQRSLSCRVPNLDELTVKKCEEADSPCMVKKIGKTILSLFTRVLCME